MEIISAVHPATRALGPRLSITEDVSGYVFEHLGVIYKLVVPEHFVFDGASIIRLLWTLLGLTPHGVFEGPALPHDFGYHHKGIFPAGSYFVDNGKGGWTEIDFPMSREVLDLLLQELCTYLYVCGKFKAWMIYRGVRMFGWVAWNRNDLERKSKLIEHLEIFHGETFNEQSN